MKKSVQKCKVILVLFILFIAKSNFSQTYNSTDYADQNDTVYLSKANLNGANFDTTGNGIVWDYSTLVGNSQTREVFANPTQTGYSLAQFAYIYNTNNTNLAQTNGQTIAVGSLTATDPYSYFKKTSSLLQQSASVYKIVVGSTSLSVKNTFDTPDILYKFPINYGDADSSNSSFSTNIPSLYSRNTQMKRVNHVVGVGTVITPYGTFNNALKIESVVTQTDSFSLNGVGYSPTTIVYKELKWLDPSKKYPVLIVRKDQVNSVFVTSTINYLDNQYFYEPSSLFAYYPVCPIGGDTIQFQNLSTNSDNYSWDFGDPSSGTNNTSSLQNPNHVFLIPGNYNVQLITYNGNLSDTVVIPVFVNQNLDSPTITITSNLNSNCNIDTLIFSSTITNGGTYPTYQWKKNGQNIIGADSSSLITNSLNNGDTITCQLISSSVCLNSLIDTSNFIVVNLNQSVTNTQTVSSCTDYFWSANGQTYSVSGTYTTTLTGSNGCDSTLILDLTIGNSITNTQTVSSCSDYFWSANGQTYSVSGTYTTTLTGSNLTIGNSITNTQTVSSCTDYFWSANGQTYSVSGTYTTTLTGSNGCDSTLILDLTINYPTSSSETVSSCNSYFWSANGISYSESGIYTTTLIGSNACDSIVELVLTIDTLNLIVENGPENGDLTAVQENASYQWYRCQPFEILTGETNQTLEWQGFGSYLCAVEITQGTCKDTSECYIQYVESLYEQSSNNFKIYPNPSEDFVQIIAENLTIKKVSIVTQEGRILYDNKFNSKEIFIDLKSFPQGVYFLLIEDVENKYSNKLVKL
ncbi:MAG: T9SS type A sorting domain-containing protein [Flavobacteriia bacterium]|nr:T9SS type A sorting domain-containing protein [Flavobacteriia bacterium]